MSEFRFTRPNRFPPVVKNLIIINTLVFIAQVTISPRTHVIENLLALHDVHSIFFKPHQVFTYMFLHGSIEHLLFNMLALWMFGSVLENFWGAKRFLQFYLISGLGAGLLHLGVLYLEMEPIMDYFRTMPTDYQLEWIESPKFKINTPTVGASGAIFGCLAAFGYHLGGAVTGIIIVLIWNKTNRSRFY
jgi:membrane associated rhomboid family serine protease